MNLTDTHCHLDFHKFEPDLPDVLGRARVAGLTRILVPGLTLDSSRGVVDFVRQDEMLYAGIGIHPTDALTWDESTLDGLRQLHHANRDKVLAIGEIGLDYYWDSAPHDVQRDVLRKQLSLAAELQLPVVIHLREQGDAEDGDCASDLLNVLGEWVDRLQGEKNPLAARPGVLHSFSGSRQIAEQAIQMNFFIGITGPITYKNAQRKRETLAALPLDHILIETDAPFLSPVPERGKRNEPAFVAHIAGKIGEIFEKHPQEIAEITSANAARLFCWGG